jgi:hypothetical protein
LDFVARFVTSHVDGFSSALGRSAISIPCPADKAPQHIEAVKQPLEVGCAAGQSLLERNNGVKKREKKPSAEKRKKKESKWNK